MMDDLRDLYQEVILHHNKHPQGKGRLDPRTHHAEGYNPLCGDMVLLDLVVGDGRIEKAGFDGQGCAISTASTSMMVSAIVDKTPAEALALAENMKRMLMGEPYGDIEPEELLALSGVRAYPVRIKCALLAWHALSAALTGANSATTEA
jgi:nitrogen fixation NifU-like protein